VCHRERTMEKKSKDQRYKRSYCRTWTDRDGQVGSRGESKAARSLGYEGARAEGTMGWKVIDRIRRLHGHLNHLRVLPARVNDG